MTPAERHGCEYWASHWDLPVEAAVGEWEDMPASTRSRWIVRAARLRKVWGLQDAPPGSEAAMAQLAE